VSTTKRRRAAKAGVTLIEMLVVVTIIAAGSPVWWAKNVEAGRQGQVTAARAQIGTLMGALNMYKMDTGVFPTTSRACRRSGAAGRRQQLARSYLEREVPNDPGPGPTFTTTPASKAMSRDHLLWRGRPTRRGGANADIVSWKSQ